MPDNFINSIRYRRMLRHIRVKEVLDYFGLETKYSRKGELYFCCPVHGDSRPSATINYDPDSPKFLMFSCFGCGFSGRLPKLVAYFLQSTIPEANDFLKQFMDGAEPTTGENINFSSMINIKQGTTKRIKVTLPPEFQLIDPAIDNSYKRYLIGRHVTEEEIKKHQWGFCATGFYKKRVILPIYVNRILKTFYGRHIETENPKRKVFNAVDSYASESVFPHDEIKKDTETIWITESVFNYYALKRVGVMDVVALLGNKLTDWKIEYLKKFSKIIIIPDGDDGGRELIRTMIHNAAENTEVKTIEIPEGEDAGSLPLETLGKCIFKIAPAKSTRKRKTGISINFSVKK